LRRFYRFTEKSAPSVGEALVLLSATFYLSCHHDELAEGQTISGFAVHDEFSGAWL